jgi:hypothetical protein
MALQLSELQSMRDNLQRAIYAGARRVQYNTHSVEYSSVDDMRKALVDLDAQIAKMTGVTPPSFTLATHSRD